CAPRPGTRAPGWAAWRPLRRWSGRAPWCSGPVPRAATPRTPASATRCRAGRSWPGDVPAIRRHSRHGSHAPPPHAPLASAPTEGQRNPRDLAAGLDRLVAPAMQQAKQPFCTRLQLLAWLALNAGKHTGNQPTRLAHLDDGNDRAILVQGDEGPAQVVRLGHQGTPSVGYSDDGAISSPPAPYHLSGGGRWIRTS